MPAIKKSKSEPLDIEIVQGAKDLASIKKQAEKEGHSLVIVPKGKEGRDNVYVVRTYPKTPKRRIAKPKAIKLGPMRKIRAGSNIGYTRRTPARRK